MSFKQQVIRALTPLGLVKPVEMMTRGIRWPLKHRAMRQFYGQFVNQGELCFDVGANEGEWTHVLATLGARVVAVEPQPDVAERLRRRFSGNRNVAVVAKGLAAAEGTAQLTLSGESSQLATMSEAWRREGRWKDTAWANTIEVPTTTLDRLIADHGRPAFCKIDVEGYEAQVLSGLSGQAVRVIGIEYDTTLMGHVERCVEMLDRLGETRFNYSVEAPRALSLREWVKKDELLAVLRQPEHEETYGDIYARFD